jgi:uncharacterized protein YkwD
LPAPPVKPYPYAEFGFDTGYVDTGPDAPPASPRRRRPLHPAILAAVAVLAVTLASTVGAVVFRAGRAQPAVAAGGPERGAAVTPPPTAETAITAVPTVTANASPATPIVQPTASPARSDAPPEPTRPAPPPPATKPTGDAALEAAVFDLVNQERAKAGCQSLSVDTRLTTAAREHSADMANRDYFDHNTPEGVTVATRVTNAGYKWSSVGENIAKGQKDAVSVMQSWMNSPGHRANILNCGYRNIGIGVATDSKRTKIWTQDFASPLR